MDKCFRRIGLVPTALMTAALLGACNKGSNVSGAGPGTLPPKAGGLAAQGVPVTRPGGEVDAAKDVMRRMASAKKLTDIGPCLSNRSAAAFGIVLLVPVTMASAFAEFGEQFASLAKQGGAKPAADPAQDKKLQEIKALKSEVEAVLKKYSVSDKAVTSDSEAKRLESRGREFFHDMASLLDRLGTATGNPNAFDNKSSPMAKDVDKLEFTVVSPTEVKIVDKNKKADDPDARAILEDGQWRIDIGGLDQATKLMGASSGAGMPRAPAPSVKP